MKNNLNTAKKLKAEIQEGISKGYISTIDATSYIKFLEDLLKRDSILNLIRQKGVNVSLILNNDTYSNYLYDLEKTYEHVNDNYLTKEELIKNNALTREEFQKLKEVL